MATTSKEPREHNRMGKRARMGQASLSKRITVATRFKEDNIQGSAFQVQDPQRCRYDVTEDYVRMAYQFANGIVKHFEADLREQGFEDAADYMHTRCYPLWWFQERFNLTDEELEAIRAPLEEKGLIMENDRRSAEEGEEDAGDEDA